MKVDVVVVGAGIAGLAAALEAKKAGANTIVFEKLRSARGNTYYSGGGCLSKISGTPEEIVSESLTTGKGRVDSDLVRTFALRVNEGIDWLASMGLQWFETVPLTGRPERFGDDALARLRVKGHGAAICRVMLSALEKEGMKVQYETQATRILTDGEGKVVGLRVKEKEKEREVEAKGIVLATGGFQGNKEMVRRHLGSGLLNAKYSGTPFNTGDGHRMAIELGAQLVNTDQWHASLRNKHRINPYPRLQYGSLLVNSQGLKFVDEVENTKDFVAKETVKQEGCRAVVVFDEGMKKFFKKGYEEHLGEYPVKGIPRVKATDLSRIEARLLEDGTLIKASSLRELSEKAKVHHPNLEETIKQHNQEAKTHEGKVTRIPIETPPFYAEEVTGRFNCTLGGVQINSEAQVLKAGGEAIPGLYAAGEIMGGFYYDNYQVITGYLPVCLVFGRIAGRNGAKLR
jgi:succinate dehydrogenase/fumarate reductase flavoprotein subunit